MNVSTNIFSVWRCLAELNLSIGGLKRVAFFIIISDMVFGDISGHHKPRQSGIMCANSLYDTS